MRQLNFEGLQMQKWNITMSRVQTVDEKNWVTCLVVMFTLVLITLVIVRGHVT